MCQGQSGGTYSGPCLKERERELPLSLLTLSQEGHRLNPAHAPHIAQDLRQAGNPKQRVPWMSSDTETQTPNYLKWNLLHFMQFEVHAAKETSTIFNAFKNKIKLKTGGRGVMHKVLVSLGPWKRRVWEWNHPLSMTNESLKCKECSHRLWMQTQGALGQEQGPGERSSRGKEATHIT